MFRAKFQSVRERKVARQILQEVLKRPEALRSSDRLIGVDGGVLGCLEWKLRPDLAVGDWDSVPQVARRRILSSIPHFSLSPHKDRSDFHFALRLALQWNPEEIIALGFTGGRPDHHLATLLDLAELTDEVKADFQFLRLKRLVARGVEGDYYFLSGQIPVWKGFLKKGKTVSLFSMSGVTRGVVLRGFQYSFGDSKNSPHSKNNDWLHPSSHGLSNLVSRAAQEIRIGEGKLLIVVPRVFT
jgi:thiamine pyrophosphokinase